MKNVVIIPIYHPDDKFLQLLDQLKLQKNISFDVYIIDSDYDIDFEFYKEHLEGLSTIVKKTSHDEFNHGNTRRKAAEDCVDYTILIYMTQDAVPVNENTLADLVKVFENEKVGCAYGRQLAHQNADILAARARSFNYPSKSKLKQLSDVKKMGIKVSFISDTFAAYRNTILNDVGNFPNDVILGEDTYVASKMILAGWIVAYCANAQVYHSHNYTIVQEFRRYFDTGVFHARENWIRKKFGQAEGEGRQFFLSEIKYLLRYRPWLLPVAIIRNGFKFMGYHIGLCEKNIALIIKKKCSMMPSYWEKKKISKCYTFSLVVATCGRYSEVDRLLESISHQCYDLNLVEVLIIDQNTNIDLVPIIGKYKDKFHIQHIQSSKTGTSYNRNLGILKAEGDILAFPDDDSMYYEDTLKIVNQVFNENLEVSCFLGKIYDRNTQINIIRNWKSLRLKITWWNFYCNYSEITTFVRREKQYLFCEKLGPGEKFGSCEGIDYLVKFLKNNDLIEYNPQIEVWHPEQTIEQFDINKNYRYGMGFGAFCKKNVSTPVLLLFLEVMAYHALFYIRAVIRNDKDGMNVRKECIISRIQGFKSWR